MAWGTPSRERRVLKAGHSSIAVTLPKPWAEAMNLRPGDVVVFDQNDDGTLYLKPAPAPGATTASVPFLVQAHAFSTPGLLERLIVGAYRVGHDAIEIRSDVPLAPDRMEELLDTARGLLGVSVVAQEPNRIVLQNFVDPSKYGLPQLVQRTKMILVAFLEEIEEVLRKRTPSRRLTTLQEESGKVLALLVRQLFLSSRDWSLARRIGSPDPRHLLEWRVVVHALEELATTYGEALARLNGQATKLGSASGAALAETLPELRSRLKEVIDALIHPSLDHACEVFHDGGETGRTPSRARSAAAGASLQPVAILLQRSTTCLELLSVVAIDRAVSAGVETVLGDTA